MMENRENFRTADWTRSGKIEGVPEDLVNRLIPGMSSAGEMTIYRWPQILLGSQRVGG